MAASIALATGALAHAALTCCASQVVLAAVTLPTFVFRAPAGDGEARLSASSCLKKREPIEIQMHAVSPIKASAPPVEASAPEVVPADDDSDDGEDEVEAGELVEAAAPAPVTQEEDVVIEAASTDDDDDELIEDITPAGLAAAAAAWPPLPADCDAFYDNDESAPPRHAHTPSQVADGAMEVYNAAVDAGAAGFTADVAVGFYYKFIEQRFSIPNAADRAVRFVPTLIREHKLVEDAKAGRNGVVIVGAGNAVAAAAGPGSLLGWAAASPENTALFHMGVQAGAILGVAAVAAVAVAGVAVGALGVVAIARMARRARGPALLPGPHPSAAGLLPPVHPSSDRVNGMPPPAPVSTSSIWDEITCGIESLCEHAADAMEAWEAVSTPRAWSDDGFDFMPPPPLPVGVSASFMDAAQPGRGSRRFIQ